MREAAFPTCAVARSETISEVTARQQPMRATHSVAFSVRCHNLLNILSEAVTV